MPSRTEKFTTEGFEGAPSRDIDWHFEDLIPNSKGNVVCKICGKVTTRGIIRFKVHIAHRNVEVAPCSNVTSIIIRENMMKLLRSQVKEKWIKRGEQISSSHRSVGGYGGERSIPSEFEFTLRGTILGLVKSKSLTQLKVSESILKICVKKMGEAVFKFLIYDQLPFQLASSSWVYNLIKVSMKVGQGVKLPFPTPYEISCVFDIGV
ncbi:hypothetical protein GQ457_04G016780 [Hibiscus cannabinus]